MKDSLNLAVGEGRHASAARSEVYKILSRVFSYPESEEARAWLGRTASRELHAAAVSLPFSIPAAEVLGEVEGNGGADHAADLEVRYTSLFDNCEGKPALSLHEKDYSKKYAKTIWEDLIRFYEHFGLAYDLNKTGEWPDHLVIELEFLHYLTFLETGCSEAQLPEYVAAQSDFLERHLAEWIPRFGEKVSGIPESAPYGTFSRVLAEFVRADADYNSTRKTHTPA